jgi:hypothetical protein
MKVITRLCKGIANQGEDKDDMMIFISRFTCLLQLKLDFHHLKLVENFISFPKVQDHRNQSSELRVMPKIRKGGVAEMGTLQGVAVHLAWGGGDTALGCLVHT